MAHDPVVVIQRAEGALSAIPEPQRALYASAWELRAHNLDIDLIARVLGRSESAVKDLLARVQDAIARSATGALFSIGYEGRNLHELIEVLQDNNVDLIVDVRLNAISRRRGFSKNHLSTALGEAGIGYVHEREFGNPKENRAAFQTGDLQAGRTLFFELLRDADAAVDRVLGLLDNARVALLCYERDVAQCHRSCVIEHVSALVPSIEVSHL